MAITAPATAIMAPPITGQPIMDLTAITGRTIATTVGTIGVVTGKQG